jgi:hypothetical protein
MSLVPNFRGDKKATIWLQTILAFSTIFTLLVARNSPPSFPKAPSSHSSFSSVPYPGARPHFDSDGSQWSAPAKICLVLPPAAESEHLTPPTPLFSYLQTGGFHYNRPPPVI